METIIDSTAAGKRLDKCLVRFSANEVDLAGLSRGDFIRAIKNGMILANGLTVKPSYKVLAGDRITITIKKAKEELVPNPDIILDVIYENDNFLVINKPAGTQVHPDFNEKNKTIVNGLIVQYPQIAKLKDDHVYSYQMRPGIVHRLDKETSGALIIAKNKKTFLKFKEMFKEKKIAKKYLAIVYGTPEKKSGVIDKPLARTTNYRKQTIAGKRTKTKIREALTKYKLIESIGEKFSLLEVSPKTGRTHQIRVHLCSIGNPIVGDNLYRNKGYEKFEGAPRHMLHASEIKFELFGERHKFIAPTPKDFKEVLKSLKN
ncbi:MAG: RluA family pseudouridine synthase [Parcubacteria group bacterium]|jgi:23S rRNA pseudouridine1911/1915/1917 synthase